MKISRRRVLTGLSGLAAVTGLRWLDIDHEGKNLPEKLTILFQGDSITDAGRNRGAYYANNSNGMGQGYVRHAITELMGTHPQKELQFYNRGISGNKVFQLRDRWNEDCLILQPDVLSILIGVNDFWHTLDWNYEGTAKTYEDDFRRLLDGTMSKLPKTRLIIAEPFVLHDGTAIKRDLWKGVFEAYQVAARTVAQDYEAVFIPYQKIFDEALELAPTSYWCPDGVHPSMAGNYLMAKAWLDAFYQVLE